MLKLYYSETCPYCRKVLSFLSENNINFERKDVSDPENYEELIKYGKVAQVPFSLGTNINEQMHETDDMTDYVRILK